MFDFDNIKDKSDNNWPYRTLVIRPSGSGNNDNDVIDKIYLYAKDLEESKYQLSIKKREQAGIKDLNDKSAFIEYSNNMDDVYDDINSYNKKNKSFDCI